MTQTAPHEPNPGSTKRSSSGASVRKDPARNSPLCAFGAERSSTKSRPRRMASGTHADGAMPSAGTPGRRSGKMESGETDDLEERLENWGRWAYSGSSGKRKTAPLFCFIDRVEETGAQTREVGDVDVRDALLVQAAWSALPFQSPEQKSAKILLSLTYCEGAPLSAVLRKMRKFYHLRIDGRDVERLLEKAKRDLSSRLPCRAR